jgi:hypothetical protein
MFVHDENKFYYLFKYFVSSTTRQVINDEVPWRHDIQQNDIRHIDIQENVILSLMALLKHSAS